MSLTGPAAILLGELATFHANATGGAPPYTFHWSVNGSSVTGVVSGNATSQGFAFRPLADSLYTVEVNLTDSQGNSSVSEQFLSVTGASPVTVTLSLPGAVSPNGSLEVTAVVRGGTAPLLYRWTGPGAPAGWVSSPTFTTAPLSEGSYHISVTVRDSYGYTAVGSITVERHLTVAPASIPDWEWVAVGLGAGLSSMFGVTLWQRRRARKPRPHPSVDSRTGPRSDSSSGRGTGPRP